MRRALLVVPLLLVAAGSALLHAQDMPARPQAPVEQGRFQLQKLQKDIVVFDSATGRVYVVNDLDVVSRIDPVAGTVLTNPMKFLDRDQARRELRDAVEKGDAAALAALMSKGLRAKHPEPARYLAELKTEAGAKHGGSVGALLEEAHMVFEKGSWRLDE